MAHRYEYDHLQSTYKQNCMRCDARPAQFWGEDDAEMVNCSNTPTICAAQFELSTCIGVCSQLRLRSYPAQCKACQWHARPLLRALPSRPRVHPDGRRPRQEACGARRLWYMTTIYTRARRPNHQWCVSTSGCLAGSALGMAHAGNSPSPKKSVPVVLVARITSATPTRPSAKPSGAMSTTVSLPEAKARAFGGVETGRTKASEVVSVTGMSRYRGCTSIDCASVATTGTKMDAVATLDATEVTAAVISISISSAMVRGSGSSHSRCSPSLAERPETRHASARAKPPPSSSSTPHGTRDWMSGHVSSRVGVSSPAATACPRARRSRKARAARPCRD
mmetsp:Transcript_10475/g.22248  ORF Transcript_10475/g.22248 Transcript_10475/m.22248 type:complete len:336 (+) Transcript_10475:233-1240(+)